MQRFKIFLTLNFSLGTRYSFIGVFCNLKRLPGEYYVLFYGIRADKRNMVLYFEFIGAEHWADTENGISTGLHKNHSPRRPGKF